jgi:hypothetical protein
LQLFNRGSELRNALVCNELSVTSAVLLTIFGANVGPKMRRFCHTKFLARLSVVDP